MSGIWPSTPRQKRVADGPPALPALCAPRANRPDGVQRGLVGKIIQRFEEKGFYLRGKRGAGEKGWRRTPCL